MKNKDNRKIIYIMLIVYLIILISLLVVTFPAISNTLSYDMIKYMSSETILIFFLAIIICITVLIFVLVGLGKRNNRNKEKEAVNIVIDNERSYLEQQISELNEKLVSTDKRWREAYHLITDSQKRQIDRNGVISIESFLEGFGINIEEIKIQKDLVFVLTPFHDNYSHTYDVIKTTCKAAKMTCLKADEEFVPKDILQHIIKCIVKSRIIIANLNGRNPNVFYELGIAHALNKPTVLIAHTNTEVPFDLKNQYLVLYTNDVELNERLFDVLLKVMTRNE